MPKDSPEGEKNLARVHELVARIAELPYPPVWVGEGGQAFIDGGELLVRAPDLLPPHQRASLMDEVATIRLAREGAVPLLRSWLLLFVPMADVSAEDAECAKAVTPDGHVIVAGVPKRVPVPVGELTPEDVSDGDLVEFLDHVEDGSEDYGVEDTPETMARLRFT